MKDAEIRRRIHDSIRPQLDECDRLLDYYTEGLPPNLWQPMALRLALSTGVWKARP